jgi:hypothetical protein
MSELLNATIEIQEMSDKKGQYGLIKKIKGKNLETGQTNTYTVYDKKKDGSTSTAWTQLQDIQVGDTVSVGYAEQSGTMQDGTPFTSRIVRAFDKTIGEGRKQYIQHNGAPLAGKPSQKANIASSGQSDDYWDKKAYKQCLWNYWLNGKRNGVDINSKLFPGEVDLVWEVFKQIENDAEKRFNPSPARAALERTNPNFFKDDLPEGKPLNAKQFVEHAERVRQVMEEEQTNEQLAEDIPF